MRRTCNPVAILRTEDGGRGEGSKRKGDTPLAFNQLTSPFGASLRSWSPPLAP